MTAADVIFWAKIALYGWAGVKALVLALFVITLVRVNLWLSRQAQRERRAGN